MYKIGNDIVLISRIEKSIKSPSFLNKVFTENERLYCKKVENFAGLFAAKEAYFKALGTGIKLPLRFAIMITVNRILKGLIIAIYQFLMTAIMQLQR